MEPHIQYARTADGVSVAFATLGEGMPFVHMVYAQAASTEDPSAYVDWEAQRLSIWHISERRAGGIMPKTRPS